MERDLLIVLCLLRIAVSIRLNMRWVIVCKRIPTRSATSAEGYRRRALTEVLLPYHLVKPET